MPPGHGLQPTLYLATARTPHRRHPGRSLAPTARALVQKSTSAAMHVASSVSGFLLLGEVLLEVPAGDGKKRTVYKTLVASLRCFLTPRYSLHLLVVYWLLLKFVFSSSASSCSPLYLDKNRLSPCPIERPRRSPHNRPLPIKLLLAWPLPGRRQTKCLEQMQGATARGTLILIGIAKFTLGTSVLGTTRLTKNPAPQKSRPMPRGTGGRAAPS